jgi:carbon monoxide dehydrogenase subunit G
VNLQHEFDVPASPQATLEMLLDAARVVSCMPGATLVEVADDGTWKTTMAIKLGPVGMEFVNDVRIVENDAGAGRVRLAVSGRDKRGKGGADASVDARLTPVAGGTHISMSTDLRFSGQAAQLGRPSVIKDVSTRLVEEFAQCIRVQLSARTGAAGASAPADTRPQKPLSGLALAWYATRGVVARLFAFRSGLREKGSP